MDELQKLVMIDMELDEARDRILELEEEVMDMNNHEAELQLSLQDVLVELHTPEDSGSEDDEPLCDLNATDKARIAAMTEADHHNAQVVLQLMRSVKVDPSDSAPYAQLYRANHYRSRAVRKIKKLNRFLKRANFNDAYSDEDYWKEISDLKNLYQESEERPGLLELVAFYIHQRKKYDFFFGSSDEEEDDGTNGDTNYQGGNTQNVQSY